MCISKAYGPFTCFEHLKPLLYQALAVIEYLISHGSERAVDDIIEHTFQISVRPEPLYFLGVDFAQFME